MTRTRRKHYPTFWAAAHLVVIYIFIQTIIDFPLALYDYHYGTNWLYEPWVKMPVFFGSTLLVLYLGYYFSGSSFREIFSFKLFNLFLIPSLILTLGGLQFFLTAISIELDRVLPPPDWFLELFSRLFDPDLGVWSGISRVVIIAPIVEELIFRGVIMHGFLRNYSKTVAVILSALLFALFHLNPWQFPATFLLGLILGIVRIRTNSVLACIIGHALHNGLILLTSYYYLLYIHIPYFTQGVPKNYALHGIVFITGLFLIFLSTYKHKIRIKTQ